MAVFTVYAEVDTGMIAQKHTISAYRKSANNFALLVFSEKTAILSLYVWDFRMKHTRN